MCLSLKFFYYFAIDFFNGPCRLLKIKFVACLFDVVAAGDHVLQINPFIIFLRNTIDPGRHEAADVYISSYMDGEKVENMKLPAGSLVVAVNRGNAEIVQIGRAHV